MKIDFKRLIQESGEYISQRRFAKELYEKGYFKSLQSAYATMQRCNRGVTKSFNWELLKYLVGRFNRPGSEIITWDE